MDLPTEQSPSRSSFLPYLRAIVDSAVKGTVLIDEHKRVMLVNKTAADMVGLAIASVIGITLDEWIIKSSTFFDDPRPFLAYVQSLPRRGPVEVEKDFEIQKPNRKVLRWRCRPIDLPGGLGHLFSYLDVTAEVDRLADLEKSFDRKVAKENLTALGAVVAGMSHHINNPMAFVTANVQAMQRGLGNLSHSPELAAEYEKEILPETLEGIRRVNSIVSDLRRFAHEDTEPEVVFDVNAQIESAACALATQFPTAEVELRLGELPAISGKPAELVRVLFHLLSNAAQAVTAGAPTITVSTTWSDGTVSIEVRDNGTGMSPEIQAKLFQPFFTTRPQGKGVGLGLAVSHGLISALGGEIDVDSQPGRGSCFTVRLPARSN